jgi:hypothetical protein
MYPLYVLKCQAAGRKTICPAHPRLQDIAGYFKIATWEEKPKIPGKDT